MNVALKKASQISRRTLKSASKVASTSAAAATSAGPVASTSAQVQPPPQAADRKGKRKATDQDADTNNASNAEPLPLQKMVAKDLKNKSSSANDQSKSGSKTTSKEGEMGLSPFKHAPPFQSNTSSQQQQQQSQRQSSSSNTNISISTGGLPLPSQWALPHIRHPFNTHGFVDSLQQASFSRPAAEALMRITKDALTEEESKAARDLVGRGDLENEAYLFRAALDELRTEVQVQARNDGIALRSANGILEREVDSFNQRVREEIHDLKNNIQIEFNNRKEESTADQKSLELRILDVNNKLSVAVGDFRSELEVRKWQETRRCLVFLILGVLSGMIYLATEPIDTGAASSHTDGIPHVPTAEELGLKPDPFYVPLKRVGEEDT